MLLLMVIVDWLLIDHSESFCFIFFHFIINFFRQECRQSDGHALKRGPDVRAHRPEARRRQDQDLHREGPKRQKGSNPRPRRLRHDPAVHVRSHSEHLTHPVIPVICYSSVQGQVFWKLSKKI